MVRRIVIKEVIRPRVHKTDNEVKWLCDSLGIISGRDVEDSSFRIINELLNQSREQDLIATESVARALRMDSPRINHHLRNLVDTGLLVREKRKVVLRGGSLSSAIQEMKQDSDRMFDKLLEVSKEVDKKMGFD
jgi:predicted transcriptional regulator